MEPSSVESDPYLQVLREAIEKTQLLRYRGWHNLVGDESDTIGGLQAHDKEDLKGEGEFLETKSVASTAVVNTLGAPLPWPRLKRGRYRPIRLINGVEDMENDATSSSQPLSPSAVHSIGKSPFEEDMSLEEDPLNIKGLLRSFDEVVKRLNMYGKYKQLRAESAREKGAVTAHGQSARILAHTQTSKIRTLFDSNSAPGVLVATLQGFDAGHARRGQNLFATFKANTQTFNTPFLKSFGDTRIGFVHTKFTLPKEIKCKDPNFPNTAEAMLRYLILHNKHMQSLLMDCFWIFFLEFVSLSSLPARYLRFRQFLEEEHDAMQRSAIVRQELGIPTDGGRAHRHQRELVTENIRRQLHQYGSGLETHNFLTDQRLRNYTAIVDAGRKASELEEDTEGGNSMAKASVGRLVAKEIVAKASRRPRKDETKTLKGANLSDGFINETSVLRNITGIDMTLSRARRMLPFHLLTHSQLVNATLPQAADIVPQEQKVCKPVRPLTGLSGATSKLPPMSPRKILARQSPGGPPTNRVSSASLSPRTFQKDAPIDSPFPSPEDYHTQAFMENIKNRENSAKSNKETPQTHIPKIPPSQTTGDGRMISSREKRLLLDNSHLPPVSTTTGPLNKPMIKHQILTVQNLPPREKISGLWLGGTPSSSRPISALGSNQHKMLLEANLSFLSDVTEESAIHKQSTLHPRKTEHEDMKDEEDEELQKVYIIQTNYSSEVDPAECLLLLADYNGEREELTDKLRKIEDDEQAQLQTAMTLIMSPTQTPLLPITANSRGGALPRVSQGTPSASLSQRLAVSILAEAAGPLIEHKPLHEMEARSIANTNTLIQKFIELSQTAGGAKEEVPFITAAAIEAVRAEQDKLFSRMSHHLHRLFAFNRFFTNDENELESDFEKPSTRTSRRQSAQSASVRRQRKTKTKNRLNASDNPILDELSPAMREIKANILGPLPDVMAHMIWLELKHWLPYAEDLLGNTQRADLKRTLSSWIHGVDNTQTSHWSICEEDIEFERAKLVRAKAVRHETNHSNTGSVSIAPPMASQSSEPSSPSQRFAVFQQRDETNKTPVISPEALVAMSKHNMADPQCATAYEATIRELKAMRLGGFEETSVREERQPRRPSSPPRSARQIDAKDILRMHRFSPTNRAPRRWHERGKKASSDLGAITQASPILTNAAPGYFDLTQNSPSMRRFLTDGNSDLAKTKRSNILTWSQ